MENIQEAEEREFNPQSEGQMCVSEAESLLYGRNSEVEAQIASLIAAGRFVVVGSHAAHCRATDAIVGTAIYVKGDCATREEAEAMANASAEREYEESFEVRPVLEQKVTEQDATLPEATPGEGDVLF